MWDKFSSKELARNIVYLLIQPELSNFPWELIEYGFLPGSSTVMSEAEQHYLRTPNLEILQVYLETSKKISHLKSMDKWYYLIDHKGDLASTQKTFTKLLSKHDSWRGELGKKPDDDFYTELKRSEMYLYCGHGVGADIFLPIRLARQKMRAG